MPNLATPRRLLLGHAPSAYDLSADESGPITTTRTMPKKKSNRFRPRSATSGNYVCSRVSSVASFFSSFSSFLGRVPRLFSLCYLVASYRLPHYVYADDDDDDDDDDAHRADVRHRRRCVHHHICVCCSCWRRSCPEKICAELVVDGYGRGFLLCLCRWRSASAISTSDGADLRSRAASSAT